MKKISDFLERFKKLAQSSDDAKQGVIEALNNAGVKVNCGVQNITIRGEVATLRLSPIQKSEVSLKQKRILIELAKNPLTKNITVVR